MDKSGTKNLIGVHPDLLKVVARCETLLPKGFEITCSCGLRTLAQQKINVAHGASTTMHSRHLPGKHTGLSYAVDLVIKLNGKVRWDWPLYAKLSSFMKQAAKTEKVSIEWGGDWKSFKDGPHFQLPWAKYPG